MQIVYITHTLGGAKVLFLIFFYEFSLLGLKIILYNCSIGKIIPDDVKTYKSLFLLAKYVYNYR